MTDDGCCISCEAWLDEGGACQWCDEDDDEDAWSPLILTTPVREEYL